MGIDENKQGRAQLFQRNKEADIDRPANLTADHLEWWVAPTTRLSGSYEKPQWLALLRHLFREAAGPYTVKLIELTAEEDRVSTIAQAHLELKNGRVYQNDYHALFWIRDGKISACKEFFDSYRTGLAFGFPD